MQEDLRRSWTKTMRRRGVFRDYTVMGFQYEDGLGEIGWHITAWPTTGAIHDYWVSGDVFYSVRIHYFYMSTSRTLIEIFGAITDLDPSEKSAVLEAVSDWEKSGDSENLREH
jgi:hypothetical protein